MMEKLGAIIFWSLATAAALAFSFGMLLITTLIIDFLKYNSISGVVLTLSFTIIWFMVFYELFLVFRGKK